MSGSAEALPLRIHTTELGHRVDLVANLRPGGWLWLNAGRGMCAWGEAARVDAGTGPGRFRRAARELGQIFGSARIDRDGPVGGPIAFGSFTFDPDRPGSALVVPSATLISRGGRTWLTVVNGSPADVRQRRGPSGSGTGKVRYAGSTVSELEWLEAVARAVGEIGRGRYDKVVLARDVLVWSDEPFDLRSQAGRLAARFPECYTFAAGDLVGASPELLVGRRGADVTSVVLAGSAPRFDNPADDASAGARLQASAKDRNEHDLALASVVNPLKRVCADVDHPQTPSLLRLSNVQHLRTTVTARCTQGSTALDLAGLLHPTATVCGAPGDHALDAIRRLECMHRGRYAGPVGWVDARGDGEWAIALRCGEFSGARGRLFAGAGIVEGSIPADELEETRVKLRAMQSVLGS